MTTVTSLGGVTGNLTTTTKAWTVTATAPVGSCVVVFVAVGQASTTPSSVTDSAGNTYTAGTAVTNASNDSVRPFYCLSTTGALTSGSSTITATYSAASGTACVSGAFINSACTFDRQGTGVTGKASSGSCTSGTLASASDVVFGFAVIDLANGPWSEGAGFTTLTQEGTITNVFLGPAYDIPGATTSLTWSPSWGGASTQFAMGQIAFTPQIPIPLTGVSATGSIGALTPSITVSATGVSATGALGALAPSITVSATGVSATGALGSMGPGAGLTGFSAAGAVGSLSPGITVALTGVSAAATQGGVAAGISVAATGVAATGSVGQFTNPLFVVGLSGVAAVGSAGIITQGASLIGVAATASLGAMTTKVTSPWIVRVDYTKLKMNVEGLSLGIRATLG